MKTIIYYTIILAVSVIGVRGENLDKNNEILCLTSEQGGSSTKPSVSPDGDFVCYALENGYESVLWVSGLDGTDAWPITSAREKAVSPKWSPDGKNIAYLKNGDLMYVSLAIKEEKLVSDGSPVMAFDWAYDSNSLVYSSNKGGHQNLWIASKENRQSRRLTFAEQECLNPKWSPDGKWIAFRSNRSVNQSLWIISSNGGGERQLTSDDRHYDNCVWSPEGTRIAGIARAGRSGTGGLWLVDLEGKEEPLVADLDNHSDPVWSADGKSIFFLSNRGVGNNVWELLIESRELRRITHDGKGGRFLNIARNGTAVLFQRGNRKIERKIRKLDTKEDSSINIGFAATFSKDGKHVAYLKNKGGNLDIWMADFDYNDGVKDERRVTSFSGLDYRPTWNADGTLLAYTSRRASWDIWIAEIGANAIKNHPLFEDERDVYVSRWSPDGRHIAYISEEELSNSDIWIYRFHDRMAKRITWGMHCLRPVWSHNSKFVVFSAYSEDMGKPELFLYDVKNEELVKITSGNYDVPGSFSLDNGSFVFVRKEKDANLYLYSFVSNSLEKLTDFYGDESNPVWSADGKGLFFSSQQHGSQDIYFMDVDTRNVKVVVQGNLDHACRWVFKDGLHIFYESTKFVGDLYLKTLDSSWGREVTITAGINE